MQAIVLHSSIGDIDTVIVHGRARERGGKLLSVGAAEWNRYEFAETDRRFSGERSMRRCWTYKLDFASIWKSWVLERSKRSLLGCIIFFGRARRCGWRRISTPMPGGVTMNLIQWTKAVILLSIVMSGRITLLSTAHDKVQADLCRVPNPHDTMPFAINETPMHTSGQWIGRWVRSYYCFLSSASNRLKPVHPSLQDHVLDLPSWH